MSVKVLIPTALRQYAGGKDTVELNGVKVGEVLKNLVTEYPGLKSHLFNDNGDLRNFVNVYVNDENIRSLNLNDTNVANGDEVTLVPAVAGGAVAHKPEPPAPGKRSLNLNTRAVQLSKDEIGRYSRHLILPEVGMEGQKKLKAAKVLLVGTGGLGSPLGMYLAAAGIGKIGLVDFDVVDLSNLQRQVIHGTKDIG
ncbi:MAG: ubiquitin-like small modifier protein 1, partial [Candidatus Hydrogenedentota bacterium]